jgi:luciferase family oxidoreductase group 1
MRLGLLDIADRIDQTLELAQLAERLGYTRYWIAEHQPQPSPVLQAALVLGQTETIRVGTGGVLMHYHPPLRTAHDFRFLERVFPGRVDAGFCGGSTADGEILEADRDGRDYGAVQAMYARRCACFATYLRDPPDAARAWRHGLAPRGWSLGGGWRSAEIAAVNGLGLGYSLLYGASADDPSIIQRYRTEFVAHADMSAPQAIVAVCGVCAPTDAEAEELAAPLAGKFFHPRIVGSPARCAEQLAELGQRYAVDEIVFADLLSDGEARVRCHELLARAVRPQRP